MGIHALFQTVFSLGLSCMLTLASRPLWVQEAVFANLSAKVCAAQTPQTLKFGIIFAIAFK